MKSTNHTAPAVKPLHTQGEAIKRLRGALALRQVDVARAAGVTTSTLSALENDAAEKVLAYLRQELSDEATAAAAARHEHEGRQLEEAV